jgi:hypothetical protein
MNVGALGFRCSAGNMDIRIYGDNTNQDILTLRFEDGWADVRFDTILVLAVFSSLAGVVAEDHAAFRCGNWRGMRISADSICAFQAKLAKGGRLRSLWCSYTIASL